jgi:hypothetical protein
MNPTVVIFDLAVGTLMRRLFMSNDSNDHS